VIISSSIITIVLSNISSENAMLVAVEIKKIMELKIVLRTKFFKKT